MISVSLIICCLVPPLNSVPSSTLQAWRFHRWPNSLISAKHMITIKHYSSIFEPFILLSLIIITTYLINITDAVQNQDNLTHFVSCKYYHYDHALFNYLMHKMINVLTRGDHMPNLITSLKHWALGILQLWPLLTQRQHNKLSDRMDDKIESLFPIDQ